MAKYKFDFNAEVARAKAQFPERTRNTVFVNTGTSGAKKIIHAEVREALGRKILPALEQAKADFEEMIAAERKKKKLKPAEIRKLEKEFRKTYRDTRRTVARGIAKAAKNLLETQNFTLPWPTRPGHCMIGVNGKTEVAGVLDFATPEKERFFAFWHEVGHRVAQTAHEAPSGKAKLSAKKARGERCADAFALLTGLRRRVLTLDDAQKIIHNRVVSALTNFDEEHLTAPALEKVARGSVKHARVLTPDQTAKAAQDIARRAPVRIKDMEKLHRLNDKFIAACDVDALAEFIAASKTRAHKKPLTPLESLKRAPAFRQNIKDIFGKFAAKAKPGSVERRYCDSVIKTATAMDKTAKRLRR